MRSPKTITTATHSQTLRPAAGEGGGERRGEAERERAGTRREEEKTTFSSVSMEKWA